MSAVTPESLGLDPLGLEYWSFERLDDSCPPRTQAYELKEDMAQARLGSHLLLDVGWYPSFDPDGAFTVLLVANGDWEQPLLSTRATTWGELKRAVGLALDLVVE